VGPCVPNIAKLAAPSLKAMPHTDKLDSIDLQESFLVPLRGIIRHRLQRQKGVTVITRSAAEVNQDRKGRGVDGRHFIDDIRH
jgi:hypothetical protein